MDWQKHRVGIGAVVLLVLGAVTFWVVQSRTADETDTIEPEAEATLPEVEREAIDALEIHRPDTEVVKLEKRDDTWFMVAPAEAEADQGTVDTALDKLAELEVVRVASSNPENHARLEVGDENGIRVVAGSGGETVADLVIGKYGGGNTMVRPHDGDEVLAVDGSIKYAFNKDVKDWRNRRITDVAPADVVAIHFQNDNGEWRFERDAEDEWVQPEGQEEIERFGGNRVQSIVTSLSRMRAVGFADPDVTREAAGLGEGAAVVQLTVAESPEEPEQAEGETGADEETEGEEAADEQAQEEAEAPAAPIETETIVLRLGGDAGQEQHYLMREGSDIIYLASQFLADKIRVNAETFQVPEEGEAPTAAEGAPNPMAGGGPHGGMPGMGGPHGGMPGMGGPHGGMPTGGPHGGGQKIPPEVMQKIQQQLRQQQQQGGGHEGHGH